MSRYSINNKGPLLRLVAFQRLSHSFLIIFAHFQRISYNFQSNFQKIKIIFNNFQ